MQRDSMLEVVHSFITQLLPYVLSSYSKTSELRFGPYSISSEEGAQQGDPLGQLLFCLTIREMIASLKSEMSIANLDDVGLRGDAEVVANDFQKIEEMGSQIGLSLNRTKCEVIGHDNSTRTIFRAHAIQLPETELQDMMILGSPVLPGPGVDAILQGKRKKLERLSTRDLPSCLHTTACFSYDTSSQHQRLCAHCEPLRV